MTDPVAEAENFLRSFRQPDFVYKHTDYIECDGPGFSDWVAVSTFGSTEDLAAQNDEPETHPYACAFTATTGMKPRRI